MYNRQPVVVNNTTNGGVGFFGLLTIVFVILKLGGVIAWSWWWVFSPMLFAVGIWVFIVALLILAATLASK